MIVAEIGEAAGLEAHAVEAALVEAVRRRLHGEMRDPLPGQTVERLVQGDGIGRRQRAVGRPPEVMTPRVPRLAAG